MAVGLPIVTSDHSGNSELITDQVQGLIFSEGDLAALTEKLEYALIHYNIFQHLTISARKKVEQDFDLKKQVSKLEDIYTNIITRSKK